MKQCGCVSSFSQRKVLSSKYYPLAYVNFTFMSRNNIKIIFNLHWLFTLFFARHKRSTDFSRLAYIIKWQCQRTAHHFRYYSPRRHVWSSWCFTPFKFRYHRFLFNKLGKWSNVKPFWKGAPFAFAKHTDFSSISRSENCFWFNLLLFQIMPQQWVRRTRWRLGFPFEKRHHIDSITNGKWH